MLLLTHFLCFGRDYTNSTFSPGVIRTEDKLVGFGAGFFKLGM